MGIRERFKAARVFEATSPHTGLTYRLRRLNIAEWCDVLGGLPSLSGEGAAAVTLGLTELASIADYQRKIIGMCVVDPRVEPDNYSGDDAVTFLDLDPADVLWIVQQMQRLGEVTGARAEEARRFPEGQNVGADAGWAVPEVPPAPVPGDGVPGVAGVGA